MSSIIYNGHEIQDLIINGNQAQLWLNGQKLYPIEEPAPSIDSVTIGSQTWTSKNLAIDDGLGDIYTQTVNYGQGDVVEYYYTWDAAVRVAATVEGWHLPSAAEWGIIVDAVGGASIAGLKLKSIYGWNNDRNGTDDYGFSAFPAGGYDSGRFIGFKSHAYFWTATEYSSTNSYARNLTVGEAVNTNVLFDRTMGMSVRLVKD